MRHFREKSQRGRKKNHSKSRKLLSPIFFFWTQRDGYFHLENQNSSRILKKVWYISLWNWINRNSSVSVMQANPGYRTPEVLPFHILVKTSPPKMILTVEKRGVGEMEGSNFAKILQVYFSAVEKSLKYHLDFSQLSYCVNPQSWCLRTTKEKVWTVSLHRLLLKGIQNAPPTFLVKEQ